MTTFKLNDQYTVVCESQNTRSGFRHVAVLMDNDYEVYRTKITYQNRTWERYEFQSVLYKLIETYFKNDVLNRTAFLSKINK
jgi:hypothetical protein